MRKLSFLLIASVLLVLAGCMPSTNGIMQVSTIDALLAGVYEGHMSLQTLRQYGDFGLGTFEALDGEMLLLDGTFYKVRADGTVLTPPLTEETPFAAVTYFVPTHTELIQGPIDMAALESRIDTIVPAANHPVAFRLHGTFSKVVTRSVPAQEEPYPPLAEVTKNQSIFDLTDVTGTLMGFRLPLNAEARASYARAAALVGCPVTKWSRIRVAPAGTVTRKVQYGLSSPFEKTVPLGPAPPGPHITWARRGSEEVVPL